MIKNIKIELLILDYVTYNTMNTLNIDTISNITSYLNYKDVVYNEVLYISKTFYTSCKLNKMKEFKVIYDIYNMLKDDLLYITTGYKLNVAFSQFTFLETLTSWESYNIFQYIMHLPADTCNLKPKMLAFKKIGKKLTKLLSEIENRKKRNKRKTVTRTNTCHKVAREFHIISW